MPIWSRAWPCACRSCRSRRGIDTPARGGSRRSPRARDPLPGDVFEPVGELLVEAGADLLRHRLVRGDADQVVTEGGACRPGSRRSRTKSLRTSENRWPTAASRSSGRQLDQRAVRAALSRSPRPARAGFARGSTDGRVARPAAPGSSGAEVRELGDTTRVAARLGSPHRDHLLDEERIPLRRCGNPDSRDRRERDALGQLREQPTDSASLSASSRTTWHSPAGDQLGRASSRSDRASTAAARGRATSRRGTRSGRAASATPNAHRRSRRAAGRSRASSSRSVRIAQNVSSAAAAPARPTAVRISSAIRASSSSTSCAASSAPARHLPRGRCISHDRRARR